jgi:hypothetical protein
VRSHDDETYGDEAVKNISFVLENREERTSSLFFGCHFWVTGTFGTKVPVTRGAKVPVTQNNMEKREKKRYN